MQNRNFSISQDLNRIFDLKGEQTDFVSDIIVPIVEIKRICDIIRSAGATNATSATVYTTPSDKDFYLVSAQLSLIKDVNSTSTSSLLIGTINGVSQSILRIASLTLTAHNDSISISLPNPIKIDRNTTIQILNSTNVANVTSTGVIHGYTVETTK